MHAETLPPHRQVSSRAIPLADASKILDKYLSYSELHPHLHPDALITPAGVTFSSHGGPTGGVVMHNLRRVAAGLRGEYLEPEATPEPEEQEDQNANDTSGSGKKGKRKNAAVVADDEWQNMSEFEREEGEVEVGEVGARVNVVQEGEEAPEVEVTEDVEEDGGRKRKTDGESKMDKEARKKAKKARNKEFKAKKEKARVDKSK